VPLPASFHHPSKEDIAATSSLIGGLVSTPQESAGRDRATHRRRVGFRVFKEALKDDCNGVYSCLPTLPVSGPSTGELGP
jgi:hypothetical protein